jgi:PLP dependent protein
MSEQEQILLSYGKIMQKVSSYPGARLVAVSKKQSVEKIKILLAAGHLDFGENYLQEWEDKVEALPKTLRWHFIGQLQSRKLKTLVDKKIYAIHSLGSLSAFQKSCQLQANIEGGYFIQVNLAEEEQKGGLNRVELDQVLSEGHHSSIKGLMTIPPADFKGAQLRAHFREIKTLNDQYGFKELSMGMSEDWECALDEGSTHIRVGSALFGQRT